MPQLLLPSMRLARQQKPFTADCYAPRNVHKVSRPSRIAAELQQKEKSTGGPVQRRSALLSQAALLSLSLRPPLTVALEDAKQRTLPIEEVKDIIAHDFQSRQYYITGRLTPSVFANDCVFSDPTTRVQGVEKYSKAVAALFDRSTSRADLISIQVDGPHTISARWRFAASLNIPGKPKLKPYTGTTTYTTDAQGRVCEHAEDWDISALDAFVSILLPGFGAPPAPPVEHPVEA